MKTDSSCSLCGAPHACPFQLEIPPRAHASRGLDGILNINKPQGKTSHDVVHAIRRMSGGARTGHAGTLDPLATGVLLVCLGRAVRVTAYLTDHDKKYRARVRLGIETDTYDATGTIVAQHAVTVTREQVENVLQQFVGQSTQVPPAYSAIKQDGVRLYKLARRGIETERVPRPIAIYSVTVREIALPDVEFDVHCSKGTYIRALAHDLGARLGCGACLTALTRLASGHFTLDDAVTLDQVQVAFAQQRLDQYLRPLDRALLQFQAVAVNAENARRIQQGHRVHCGRAFTTPLLRAYAPNGECLALLEPGARAGEWKPHKVFV